MARLSQLLTASLAIFGASAASAVIDLIPKNFDNVVMNGKPSLVEFFAPWCGHCKTLAPIYEDLASNFEFAKDKVNIAKVDADAEKELGKKFGIQGFPTLKWFDGVSAEPEDYNGGRDLESLASFISEKTGIKAKAQKTPPSAVQMLNDKTFKEQIGKGKDAIVAFTAPWCGHCKTLAPTWEKLATDFAAETGVLIAKVDCEAGNAKAIAQEAGVKSFPTIKFYPKGSTEAVPYVGGRSHEDLIKFVNEQAGTHRLVGGTLDTVAGTIASLDTLVANLKAGGETAYAELEKAAAALKDKYAEYYGKVAKKAEANKEYVDKELKRLQGILKKGGLAPEKVDELTSRRNILSKFKGEDEDEGKSEL